MEGVIIPKITFTNARGEAVTFTSSGYPYLLQTYEGFGEVDADIQSQRAPYQDGSTYIDTLLQNRPLSLGAFIEADTPSSLSSMKRHIGRVFNPKLGEGLLQFERYGEVYEIRSVADGTPSFLSGPQNSGPSYQKIMIDLIAHDPYWKNPEETSRALRAYQGGLTLPFTLPFELSVTGDTTNLENKGDEPTPVQIDIQGPVTNPRITNKTTDQFIQMNQSISADEILHLDTSPRAIRAELYREGEARRKVLGWRDPASDFWLLEPGKNEIQFIADAGGNDAAVAVSWQNRYLGI